ncbi:MAG: hypothetical protein CSA40_00905 [Flavobacteriales bacterium]|nr:MAG: hypothetical protein CSA40_00905 [Flavobacteriales bacterium]
MQVEFTIDQEQFMAYEGVKMSYTKRQLSDEFFVRNTSLLFEQGIRDIESRYEEYYPQVHDQYDRYKATNSVAVQNDFIERPVVDIWAMKLLAILKERFPNYEFPIRNYQNISTINVNEAFAYKHLGLFRQVVGVFKDVYQLKLENIIRRFSVVLGLRKDPYDKYKELLELAKANHKKIMFFFLFGAYNTFDKNISFSSHSYKMLIKSLIDYTPFGILFSYFTHKNTKKIAKEKMRLEEVVNRPVIKSRQHFNRLEIPKTYQILIENDVKEEYTMGYHTCLGFRAGTCSHFYFYDLEYEIQTPLKVLPFCVVDELMKKKMQLSPQEARAKIRQIQEEVKAVNGMFISIFHTHVLSGVEDGKDWMEVYKTMIEN